MQDFYFTFMQRQTDVKDCYVQVTAPDVCAARVAMCQKYGTEWAFCYTAEQFTGAIETYGLRQLNHITAEPKITMEV